MLVVSGGPHVNVYDAIGLAVWVVATGLLIADAFRWEGTGVGPMTAFGCFAALIAAVLTAAGIARRLANKILSEMHQTFDMGYEAGKKRAVSEIGSRR